jgi:hypothetical protein
MKKVQGARKAAKVDRRRESLRTAKSDYAKKHKRPVGLFRGLQNFVPLRGMVLPVSRFPGKGFIARLFYRYA